MARLDVTVGLWMVVWRTRRWSPLHREVWRRGCTDPSRLVSGRAGARWAQDDKSGNGSSAIEGVCRQNAKVLRVWFPAAVELAGLRMTGWGWMSVMDELCWRWKTGQIYCRILGFATEYKTSVRKFTAT